MENHCSFKFKLVDIVPYLKGDKKMARIITYCNYGFIVNLFTSEDIANKLKVKSKESNFDLTNYVSVKYDNNDSNFHYFLLTNKIN